MPVNVALGHVSNAFLIAALVIYSFSVVAFAGDFAFGRPRRAAATRGIRRRTGPRPWLPSARSAVRPRPLRLPGLRHLPGQRLTAPPAGPTRCPS